MKIHEKGSFHANQDTCTFIFPTMSKPSKLVATNKRLFGQVDTVTGFSINTKQQTHSFASRAYLIGHKHVSMPMVKAYTGYVSFYQVYNGRFNRTAQGLPKNEVETCIEKSQGKCNMFIGTSTSLYIRAKHKTN